MSTAPRIAPTVAAVTPFYKGIHVKTLCLAMVTRRSLRGMLALERSGFEVSGAAGECKHFLIVLGQVLRGEGNCAEQNNEKAKDTSSVAPTGEMEV